MRRFGPRPGSPPPSPPVTDSPVEAPDTLYGPLDDPLIRIAQQHPALTVAAITTAVFVLKVMFAAHLNTAVALGIVAATGPAELAVALLVLLAPTVAVYLAIALTVVSNEYYRRRRRAAILLEVSVVASLVALAIASVGSILVIVGLGIVLLVA